ncbi:MAG: hypothetical protein JWM27_4987, partial [Gemmatimonadetes bacterium]|nr:hypothetical protein [Gemmatimonadota bacterium]
LLLGGAAAGWAWRGRAAGGPASAGEMAMSPVRATPPARAAAALSPGDAEARPSAPGATFASAADGRTAGRTPSPQARQAEQALRKAEADYAAALRRYAELADPASGADAGTRLRALDGIVAATRDALDRDPRDPVANGYHLAAMEERRSLMRQVANQNESTWY